MKRILKAIIPTVVVLLAVEVVLRVPGWIGGASEADTWWVYSETLGWKPRPDYEGDVFGAHRSFGEGGMLQSDAEAAAPGGNPLILFVGDSATFGNGVREDSTFASLLGQRLQGVDVVNLAVPGYTSYQGARVLEQRVAELKPALVVVSFGFNDRRYVLDLDDMDSAEHFARTHEAEVVGGIARHSRIFRLAYQIRSSISSSDERDDADSIHLRELKPRVPPNRYRENLRRMAEVASENGAKTIFMALPDNPATTAPFDSAAVILKGGDMPNAFKLLSAVMVQRGAQSIVAQTYIVDLLQQRRLGKQAEEFATVEAPIESLHGGDPMYRDVTYYDIMRETAKRLEIPFVDGFMELRAHPEYFFDFSHFDWRGHALVADLIENTINENELLPR